MLRYFANGRIRWKHPMRCNTRTNWEFYAVLDGRCALRFSDHAAWTLHTRSLWVFAPECSHGWANDGATDYHRCSLHFGNVPYPLGELVRENGGWLRRDLEPADVDRLRAIAGQVEPHFLHPTLVSTVHFQRALMELSLMLLDGMPAASQPPALTDLANFKIERALSWFTEHLSRGPSVKEVATAIHVSPSHLRRLFRQARRTSPKAVFQRLRVEKANELMARSALTLEEVAAHCGFSSASHLCREYKAVYHFTPTRWRKRLVDRFVHPFPPGVIHLRDHSVRPQERVMQA